MVFVQPTAVEVFDDSVDALHPVAVIRRRLAESTAEDGSLVYVPVYRIETQPGQPQLFQDDVDFPSYELAVASLGV